MTTDSVDALEALTAKVDDEFTSHRQSDEFKAISLMIDFCILSVHADRPR